MDKLDFPGVVLTRTATGSGTPLLYAGPVTLVGWLIGRCVRAALEEALAQD